MPPAAPRCSRSRAPSPCCRRVRGARSWRCLLPVRSAACSARPTTRSTPRSRPGIAADINIDGGNIFGRTRDATLVSQAQVSLDQIAERLAQLQGRKLSGDRYPDPATTTAPTSSSFAKIGVPALFFNEGPTSSQAAGWGKQHDGGTQAVPPAERQARGQLEPRRHDGGCETGSVHASWLVAQADALPTWNPGDEFGAARSTRRARR